MHLPPDILHRVSLAAWQKLLRAHGVRGRVAALSDVQRVLESASDLLSAAVRLLVTLASNDGRLAVVEAARALGIDTASWPRDVSAAELVVFLLTTLPGSKETERLLAAATYRLCRKEPVAPVRRYVGHGAAAEKLRPVTPELLRALSQRLSSALSEQLISGSVVVRLSANANANDGKGEGDSPPASSRAPITRVSFDVIVPRATESVLTCGEDGELHEQTYSPVDVDRIVLECHHDGRVVLFVATASPSLLPAYRTAAGKVLFGRSKLFANAPPIALGALQTMGREGLEKLVATVPRLKAARVVDAVWDPGHEETLSVAGRNVFRTMEREELPIHGALISSLIRLDFDSGPLDLLLRVPNIVHREVSPEDAAVRLFIDGLGLDEPLAANFLALAPFDLTKARWVAAVGEKYFAWLVANKRLTRSTSRAIAAVEQPGAGRILLAFPLEKDLSYAVPEEGFDVAARLVRDADLVTYKLDLLLFGADVAKALELSGNVKMLERGSLLDLGQRALGSAAVRLFLQVGVRASEGLAERLRKLSMPAHAVLLGPTGKWAGAAAGCATVPFERMEGPYHGILAAVATALEIGDGLSVWARAPLGTRVAVDRETGAVWIDGVEMVLMSEMGRKLYRILVEAGGRAVSQGECQRVLSSAVNAAKHAKARAGRGARASFEQLGAEAPDDLDAFIEATRGGYRLTVTAWIG